MEQGHLKERDKWDLAGVPEEHVHVMAQVMETWFVADPKNVKEPVRNSVCGAYHEESICPANRSPSSCLVRS
jgi:hypothetical protein